MKAEIKESQETGNGNGKVSKSYYWFSPCVPAGNSVFDHHRITTMNIFFFFLPIASISYLFLWSGRQRMGAPYPDSRGVPRTFGSSMLSVTMPVPFPELLAFASF